jgi:hypothetical protein
MASKSDGCPSRHSKPVTGSCGICRKTVCPDCKAALTSEGGKIICRFCYEDLTSLQKKLNESYEVKIEEKIGLFDKISEWMFGKTEKLCDKYYHAGKDILGICVACRTNVCEKCVMPDKKLSTGGLICRKCCAELYDVQGEITRDRRQKFLGGLREMTYNFGRNTKLILTIALVVGVFTFLCAVATFWIFHQLHPASFEMVTYSWRAGNYKILIKQDFPALTVELKDRILFVWHNWGDPHADYDESLRKTAVKEYISIFSEEPEEQESLKDINSAIEQYKKQMQEQEKAKNKQLDRY